MKAVVTLIAASIAFGMAASPAIAASLAEINDPGAGIVPTRIGPCLIANRTHEGPPCPEPEAITSGGNDARIANRMDRAAWFILMQDFAKARDETDLAVGIDGASVVARLLRARLSMTINDRAATERDLAVLTAQAPDNPDVASTAATGLWTRGANLEALRMLHRIVAKHPDHLYSRELRARLMIQMGRADMAVADLDVIIEARPNDANAHALRAEALQALGRPLTAVAEIKASQQEEPPNFLQLIARADAYANAENNVLAVKDYDTVLAVLDGGSPLYPMPDAMRAKLLMKRATALVRLRQFDGAAADAVAAIRIGGVPAALRAQVMLRRRGFDHVPLDGRVSDAMRAALGDCFGRTTCFQSVAQRI
ncbi:MAG: tetratricopeptide repeat protein [Proteobacteria bacterium]|nr:tetratricopeptide repeat protein [Pseudomonadota bacterium]